MTFAVLSQSSSRIAGVEPGLGGADLGGGAVAARNLVGEHEQQQVVEGHVLLVGEHEPLGQRLGDATELESFERP